MGTLSTRVTSQLQSLQGLHLRLRDIGQYLRKVLDGELPVNHTILGALQDIFNLLPNLVVAKAPSPSATTDDATQSPLSDNNGLARAMSIKINDQLMSIHISSLIRAITAFHDLIENKIQNRQQEEEKELKKEEIMRDEKATDEKNSANKESKSGSAEQKPDTKDANSKKKA